MAPQAARRHAEPAPEAGEAFLAALHDPARGLLPFRAVIVLAHPDDETIACGSLLPRLGEVTLLHVTDGAPRNGNDAVAQGFASPAEYAAARRRELEAAMALGGVTADRIIWLGCADQEAAGCLVKLAFDLAPRLKGADIVLTHAYEGGHPDHDATAFAVHAATALLRAGGSAPAIVEMPLYRWGPEGWTNQSFAPAAETRDIVLELSPREQEMKRAMLAAHRSQQQMLAQFSVTEERFRIAPLYDFAELPNGGKLLYERMAWGLTGARWLEYSRATLAELRLGAAA